MIVAIYPETKEVITLNDFLNRNKNINTRSVTITAELIEQIDPAAVGYQMEPKPDHHLSFEIVEFSEPVEIEGKWYVYWIITRTNPEAINDYYNDVVDDHLDSVAKSKGWKNQDRLLGAIDSTNPNYQQEARYMRQLVDRTWDIAIPIINTEVKELTDNPARRPMSDSELINQLPVWDMPANF